MYALLLGPPGSGKGTYATRLAVQHKLPHISTGDIFRRLKEAGGELAERVAGFMSAGELVPDEIVNRVVKERLGGEDCSGGCLLDGYPRNLVQAGLLSEMLRDKGLALQVAFSIKVSEEVLKRRLSGRRTCRSCGEIFNVFSLQPKQEGVCDRCGGELYQRTDDKEEAVANRLKVYERETAPLVDYYRQGGILREIDGEGSIENVLAVMSTILVGEEG